MEGVVSSTTMTKLLKKVFEAKHLPAHENENDCEEKRVTNAPISP